MTHRTLDEKLLFRKVVSFAKPFKKPLSFVLACITLVMIVDAFSSICLSLVFDLIQKHGTNRSYLNDAFILIGIALGLTFVRIIVVGIQGKIEVEKIDQPLPNYLNHESISKFFSFSNGQHINEHSGVKQTIVNNGTTAIQNQISIFVHNLLPAISMIFVSLGVLFYASTIIGLIFLGAGIIFCYLMYLFNKAIVPGIKKFRDRKQLNSRFISELYRFVNLVKNENQEDRSLQELSDVQGKQHVIFEETWIPAIKRLQVIRISTALLRYGALFLVVFFVFNTKITIGTMFLVFTWSSWFVNGLWEITNIHKQFMLDKINIERYMELLEVKPDITMIENPIRPEKFEGKIEFKNVSFYYPRRIKSYEDTNEENAQEDPVLKDVSFVINPGEKIGIVGESGSGKSTIASLLKRNFDPQNGQILIDNNDLRLLDLNFLLKKLGSVDQEVVLFDRSIRDNILFGLNGEAKSFPDEKLKEIARITRIDAFFERLEHGFDTIVGEKGVKLSGGERQRLGIARALAKDPSILIFDEATSSLDSMSEYIVQKSIDDACEGKTSIVIAHRLSTVKNCDKILVFRHGILLAQGTHIELLGSCEYYSELVHHQMMSHSI